MCDFDNPPMPDGDGWDPSPEEIAEIERAIQDMNDGFGYEWLQDEDSEDWIFKCLKCGRVAGLMEKPFPHRFDCPMRKYHGD